MTMPCDASADTSFTGILAGADRANPTDANAISFVLRANTSVAREGGQEAFTGWKNAASIVRFAVEVDGKRLARRSPISQDV